MADKELWNQYLPVPQLNQLRRISQRKGLSVSEIVRRAIDQYLESRGRGYGEGNRS